VRTRRTAGEEGRAGSVCGRVRACVRACLVGVGWLLSSLSNCAFFLAFSFVSLTHISNFLHTCSACRIGVQSTAYVTRAGTA
jgi:hypothetical protein